MLISQAALEATGLVQPGSLVRWTTRVIMGGQGGAPNEAEVKALLAKASQTFPQAGWEARSRLAVSPEFSRDLDRFAEFLTLAGLLSLVVGGVGVANAAAGFVERKRATLAILKAIGATGTSVVMLALVEFLIVATVGRDRRRGARRGDPVRRRLAVRRAAADPARAFDRAGRHPARSRLRTPDRAHVLNSAPRRGRTTCLSPPSSATLPRNGRAGRASAIWPHRSWPGRR